MPSLLNIINKSWELKEARIVSSLEELILSITESRIRTVFAFNSSYFRPLIEVKT